MIHEIDKEHFLNKFPELTIYFESWQGEKRNHSSAKMSIFNEVGVKKKQSKWGSYFGIVPKLMPAPGTAVYQRIIDKIAARDLFDRVFIEVSKIEAINNTRPLNNGDKLKYAIWVGSDTTLLSETISRGFFFRIHASASIAYKADDVHTGGIRHFSSHPVGNREQWDSVKKYNIDGISTDKPNVALFVKDADIPTCSFKYPVIGANFNEGEIIMIKTDVGDSDSSISKVEFYRNGRLIGEDTSSPYTYSMSGVAEGKYSLAARVFDNGLSKVSAPVYIAVVK